jgi:hypothetical protein
MSMPSLQLRPAPSPDPTCFVLGGVAFEMCPAPGISWTLGDEHRMFAGAYSISPVAGEVHAVVSPAPELRENIGREIRWQWDGDVAHLETGRVRAELRRLGRGRYAATALVVPDAFGCSSLVTALTAAIVKREGGLVLHAAGVELDGRAVLFIGPSGAGKTTAANHCQGLRWIARDRAAIYPTPLGWYAAGMAGGDVIELPPASARVLPLGAIYRIGRGVETVAAVPLQGVDAIRALRESVQSIAASPIEESARLDAIVRVSDACTVGRLETCLGAPLVDTLRRSIGRCA